MRSWREILFITKGGCQWWCNCLSARQSTAFSAPPWTLAHAVFLLWMTCGQGVWDCYAAISAIISVVIMETEKLLCSHRSCIKFLQLPYGHSENWGVKCFSLALWEDQCESSSANQVSEFTDGSRATPGRSRSGLSLVLVSLWPHVICKGRAGSAQDAEVGQS